MTQPIANTEQSCPTCAGTGWIIKQHANGYSSAARCHCKPTVKAEVPQSGDCAATAMLLLDNTRCAPKGDAMRAAVRSWLSATIDTPDELKRFQSYALEHMLEWDGIAGLHALLDSMRAGRRNEIDAIEYDRKMIAAKRELSRSK